MRHIPAKSWVEYVGTLHLRLGLGFVKTDNTALPSV